MNCSSHIPSSTVFQNQMQNLDLDRLATVAENNNFLRRYYRDNARRFYETLLAVAACQSPDAGNPVIWDLGVYPGTFLRIVHHFFPASRLFGFGTMMPEAFVRSMEEIGARMFTLDFDPPYSQLISGDVDPRFKMDADLPNPDTIIMGEVLEHVFFPQYGLSEAYRVLRPGGWLILTTPNITVRERLDALLGKEGIPPLEESHISKLYEFRGHVRIYCKKDLFTLIQSAGFQIVQHRFIDLEFNQGHGPKSVLKRILYCMHRLRRNQLIVARKPLRGAGPSDI